MSPLRSELVIFDFDGVIVDSIAALYHVYLAFLSDFGQHGYPEEFDALNGPAIGEIITRLKETYQLTPPHAVLLQTYLEKIEGIYRDISLNKGVKETLIRLKQEGYELALASASKMSDIQSVLETHQISQFFSIIISGDDVKQAKPSPEIYNKVKALFPNHTYIVVEDSQNGILAAQRAGIPVIRYNTEPIPTGLSVEFNVSDFSDIKKIITESSLNCRTIVKTKAIELSISNMASDYTQAQINQVNDIWTAAQKTASLFNGKILCYVSHSNEGETLRVVGKICEYKYFYAAFHHPELNLDIKPIGISGIIIDDAENTLLAKRQNVSEYPGCFELMPSGSISITDETNISGNATHLLKRQFIEEFTEETGLSHTLIRSIEPCCMIFDENHGVYDLCATLYVEGQLEQSLGQINSEEYSTIQLVPKSELYDAKAQEKMAPTSVVLLHNV